MDDPDNFVAITANWRELPPHPSRDEVLHLQGLIESALGWCSNRETMDRTGRQVLAELARRGPGNGEPLETLVGRTARNIQGLVVSDLSSALLDRSRWLK